MPCIPSALCVPFCSMVKSLQRAAFILFTSNFIFGFFFLIVLLGILGYFSLRQAHSGRERVHKVMICARSRFTCALTLTNMIWSQDSEPGRASLPIRVETGLQGRQWHLCSEPQQNFRHRGSHTDARKPCVWNALVFPQTLYHALLWADFNLYSFPCSKRTGPFAH